MYISMNMGYTAVSLQFTAACAAPFLAKREAGAEQVYYCNVQQL